ncbi:ABC transporter ATP-binding protein [Dermabacteraceae bacterium P13101]
MRVLLEKTVNAREVRTELVLFVLGAAAQGVALALMIPFLRSFLGTRENLTAWTVAIVAAGVAALLLNIYAAHRSYRLSVYEICDTLMARILERTLRLPLGWFSASNQARVISAVSRELNTISHITSMLIPNLVDAFVVPIVMLVVVFFVDPLLCLVMVLAIPPLALTWRWMLRVSDRVNEEELEAARDTAGRLVEYAKLQTVLRAAGKASIDWQPLGEELEREHRAVMDSMQSKVKPSMTFSFLLQAAFGIALLLGLSQVIGAKLDMAAYLAIMVVAARMLAPLSTAIMYNAEMYKARMALEAVDGILSAPTLPEPQAPVAFPREHSLTFTDVSFGYDGDRPVLNGINLEVESGSVTALVGESGCGKSTLLRLAGRFWDVNGGSVRIGGIDVRDIPTEELLERISFVFQDVYLFDTTIRENVRLARPGATDEEIAHAARQARLDSVIATLPDGWDTQVGPGGKLLSGGERQRVAIARAFIKDSPILLLDEVTSALDGENEAAITGVIRELAKGRTVLMVAHRLTTVRTADKVVVLRPGESGQGASIAQVGTYDELAGQPGAFARMVEADGADRHWRLR